MVHTHPTISSAQKRVSLELPEAVVLTVTIEQFEILSVANRDFQFERTDTGELIVNSPTGWEMEERKSSLNEHFFAWNEQTESGKVFDSPTAFTLSNGTIRSPDASWVSRARWNTLSTKRKGTFSNICPYFVVELRSPSDNLKPTQKEMQEYMKNGALLGWLINPKKKKVEVYQQS